MTTSTSTHHETQGSPTWVLWLFGIALIILFIWLWNTANSAKSLAEANAALLAQPTAEVSFLVGGPTRFSDSFQEAVEDAEIDGFSSDDYLWATTVVRNEGQVELDDVELTFNMAEGLEPTVIADLPSFGSGVDLEETEAGLQVDLRDIDDGELARVFVGFEAADLPEQVAAAWARNYRMTLGSLTVETDDFSETVYGRGI
ncbi:MAG TPA: hypothetical protein VF168_06610 [Trueperaceae bacterium]